MKIVKFRAWDKKHKKMFAVHKLEFNEINGKAGEITHISGVSSVGCTMAEGKDYFGGYNVKRLELMQYVGLCDKNGKEIYEGDIIQTYFRFGPQDAGYGVSQYPFIVSWEKDRLSFRAKKPSAKAGSFHLLEIVDFVSIQSNLYEVIGNIYENPELIP